MKSINKTIIDTAKRTQNELVKVKQQNAELLEALGDILDQFPDKPKLPLSHKVIEIATEAIKNAKS